MSGLADRISHAPVPVHIERGDDVLAKLEGAPLSSEMWELLHGASASSPYLARLILRHCDWLSEIANEDPDSVLQEICQGLRDKVQDYDRNGLANDLRHAKSRAALLIALADLGGVWTLGEVTGGLTLLADTAVEVAARWLLARSVTAGRLPGLTPDDLANGGGLVVLAMGKMGARELNYSSDIDLIVLFDDEMFDADSVLDARGEYVRITRDLLKLLSENTAHGYVFRTDLRLRPSPSTTPVCIAMSAAERYYETVGRTWERAAHIKARPLVAVAAGRRYLEGLTPFIWRRHLDFAAIEDTQDLLRKIRQQTTQFTVGSVPGHDLKLGPGGIREIEFFAQTRQLIMGGRAPELRARGTVDALDALASEGWIEAGVRDGLTAHYNALRGIEHRIQMLEDAQTHTIPKAEDARLMLAGLCGEASLATFDGDLAARLSAVHETCETLYTEASADETSPGAPGLDCFERPDDAARTLSRWREGGIAATRSERAQVLIKRLEPQIIERLSRSTRPDLALSHFDRFISGLPAGVQLFSLFAANPNLLDLIIQICTSAPNLGDYLSRHPQTLDAFVAQDFWQPLPSLELMEQQLELRLADIVDYERVLDETRRWSREMWFRAGVHVLQGISDHIEAGGAFSRIAETFVRALLPRVHDDFAERHGRLAGRGMVVLAMGKLGTQEMTAGSDLDLITIYDGVEGESDGRKPLAAQAYYPRLTQALIAALTAQTAEGALYEVDMRLRPSGRSGPVSVSLNSFKRYQAEEAWVWEHMALTRARPIAGDSVFAADVSEAVREAVARRNGADDVLREASEMRARLVEANAAQRGEPWSLKLSSGGLMELEFLAQALSLLHGTSQASSAHTVFEQLSGQEAISDDELATLQACLSTLQPLQQIERLAVESGFHVDVIGSELQDICLRATRLSSMASLGDLLRENAERAEAIVSRYLPLPEG